MNMIQRRMAMIPMDKYKKKKKRKSIREKRNKYATYINLEAGKIPFSNCLLHA